MSHSWPMVPLGEVLTKSEEWVNINPEETYKEVTVRLWGKGVGLRREVGGAEIAASRRLRVKAEQFILSRIDARNGAFGLVPDSLNGAVVSNDFPVFSPNPSRILPAFLNWMSKTQGFVDICKAASEGTTNRVRLQENRFLAMEVSLPPLSEQRRIVARIEELAAKIEEARGFRTGAANQAKAVSRVARDEVFGKLSQELETVRLDSIADSRLGKMLSQEAKTGVGATPYLRNANIQWDYLDLSSVYEMDFDEEEKKTFSLHAGDILVCEGGDIGKAAIWNDEIPGCCYQKALHRIRVDPSKIVPRYMLHHIFWAAEQDHFTEIKTQTTIAHLTGVKLKAYGVFVPPIQEQRRIVAYLDTLQTKVDALKHMQAETAAELDAMLPSILDKAFKGEL